MIDQDVYQLQKKVEQLEEKLNNVIMDLTYIKASDIIKARQLEDSTINRTLLRDLMQKIEDSPKITSLQVDSAVVEHIKTLVKEGVLDEVVQYLREEKKIMAIKLVRQYTQLGLKEAKDFVDKFDVNKT